MMLIDGEGKALEKASQLVSSLLLPIMAVYILRLLWEGFQTYRVKATLSSVQLLVVHTGLYFSGLTCPYLLVHPFRLSSSTILSIGLNSIHCATLCYLFRPTLIKANQSQQT